MKKDKRNKPGKKKQAKKTERLIKKVSSDGSLTPIERSVITLLGSMRRSYDEI